MADNPTFSQLVPGFEFLQNLVKNAGSALPSMGQWVAPTLDPDELEKRIGELRTVQFWLEQNAKIIAGTVQALEVQRMTLSTLKSMNVQMGDLRQSLTPQPPATPARAAEAAAPAAPASASEGDGGGAAGAPPLVDPMQWWGALTKQFTDLAATALKEPAATPQGEPSPAPASSTEPTRTAKAAGTPSGKRPGPRR